MYNLIVLNLNFYVNKLTIFNKKLKYKIYKIVCILHLILMSVMLASYNGIYILHYIYNTFYSILFSVHKCTYTI